MSKVNEEMKMSDYSEMIANGLLIYRRSLPPKGIGLEVEAYNEITSEIVKISIVE